MSELKVILISMSDEQRMFGSLDLKLLMNRAMRVEQRMVNKVMIEDEQRRYNIYCDRIEFYGHQLLAGGQVQSCDLGSEYLDLIASLKSKFPDDTASVRLTASFCPKEMVGTYIKQFEDIVRKAGVVDRKDVQSKLVFYRSAETSGCSVIELIQPWISTLEEPIDTSEDFEGLKESFMSLKVSDEVTEDKGGGHFIALRNQIEKVIEQTNQHIPASVNFSALRHDVIAEILHDFVFKGGRPLYVSVIYADGSEARPFPLCCVRPRAEQTLRELRGKPILNVGMMSARHSNDGLDSTVKTYWFRNQEISIGRTQAETDEVAYKKSKEMFESLRSEDGYRIAFYQTGFQPAVVGFYRALTEELIFREKLPADLEVTPYYFMGGTYKKGKVWC